MGPINKVVTASDLSSSVKGLDSDSAVITDRHGKVVEHHTPLSILEGYTVSYNWSIPDNVMIKDGDTVSVTIPTNVRVPVGTVITLYAPDRTPIGTFNSTGGNSGVIIFNDYFKTHSNNKSGSLSMLVYGTVDDNGENGGGSGGGFNSNITKVAWLDQDGVPSYAIGVNYLSETWHNVVLTDDTTKNQNIDWTSFKVISGSYDDNGDFEWDKDWTELVEGSDYSLTKNEYGFTIVLGNITTGIEIEYKTNITADGNLSNTAAVTHDGTSDKAVAVINRENQGGGSGEENTSFSGQKTWIDDNNAGGTRPNSIVVHLLQNGKSLQTKIVQPDTNGDWKYEFTNLPKYDDKGAVITYTISEDAVPDYSTSYTGYDIVNSYTPGLTSISGKKVWVDGNDQDGIRPDSIKIHLLANGVDTGKITHATYDDNWTYNFENLKTLDSNGKFIEYSIKEDLVNGYTSTVNGTTITNTHATSCISVKGKKMGR